MARLTFYVRHDLVEYNGQEASRFYIVGQDTNTGRRIALSTSTQLTIELHEQQEVREKLNRRIISIEKHLAEGGSLNPVHWKEIEPVYGSEAWQLAERIGMLD